MLSEYYSKPHERSRKKCEGIHTDQERTATMYTIGSLKNSKKRAKESITTKDNEEPLTTSSPHTCAPERERKKERIV